MTTSTVTSPLSASAAPASVDPKTKKIHNAAQQFEALMVGEMLKSARESDSDGWLGSGGSTGDDSAMDMAESQFSNALAKSGGLGLAKMIESSMSRVNDKSQNVAQSPYAASLRSSEKL